jgi:hypothetical protein
MNDISRQIYSDQCVDSDKYFVIDKDITREKISGLCRIIIYATDISRIYKYVQSHHIVVVYDRVSVDDLVLLSHAKSIHCCGGIKSGKVTSVKNVCILVDRFPLEEHLAVLPNVGEIYYEDKNVYLAKLVKRGQLSHDVFISLLGGSQCTWKFIINDPMPLIMKKDGSNIQWIVNKPITRREFIIEYSRVKTIVVNESLHVHGQFLSVCDINHLKLTNPSDDFDVEMDTDTEYGIGIISLRQI